MKRISFAVNTLNKIEYITGHIQNFVVGEKMSGDRMFNVFLNEEKDKIRFFLLEKQEEAYKLC